MKRRASAGHRRQGIEVVRSRRIAGIGPAGDRVVFGALLLALVIVAEPGRSAAEPKTGPAAPVEATAVPAEQDPELAEARQAVRMRQFARAVQIWEAAAKRGNMNAAYQLGVAYRSGRGVAKDLAKAAAWFERAAAAGDPDAQYALGILCESGHGVERDRDRALDLLARAARSGHPRAAEALERMRASGSIAYATAHPRVALHRLDPRAALLRAIRLGDVGAAREALARGAPVDGARGDEKNPRPLLLAIESGHPELVRLLLEHKADPKIASPLGEPALILAVRSGDRRLVQPLLAAGAPPDARSRSGYTALMEAARAGSSAIVDLLVAAGADPRTTAPDGSSAADVARRFGSPSLAQKLARSGAPTAGASSGSGRAVPASASRRSAAAGTPLPPIVEAARRGDAELLGKLLGRGADPATRDAEGDAALHRAADEGHVEAVRVLLGAGADPDARGHDQTTPLMRAMASEAKASDAVIDVLLGAGADPHARDASGATAFHHGARGATESKLARLKAAGATWTDHDARDTLVRAVGLGSGAAIRALLAVVPGSDGRIAAVCAASAGAQAEPLQILVDARVPLDGSCGDGRSPLLLAVQAGRADRVAALLAAGASPDFAEPGSDSALIGAASRGHTEIVERLIAAGAAVDRRGSHRATALMGAAANGHAEVVRVLLAAGADPRMRSETDRTAVELARGAGHEEVAGLIESKRGSWAGWLGRSSPPR
ncbi:MAG: ankyrin repeat domain-containing protein [Myxococcota bacterium]